MPPGRALAVFFATQPELSFQSRISDKKCGKNCGKELLPGFRRVTAEAWMFCSAAGIAGHQSRENCGLDGRRGIADPSENCVKTFSAVPWRPSFAPRKVQSQSLACGWSLCRPCRLCLNGACRAFRALAGGFAVSRHCAPPLFRLAELLEAPLKLWLSSRCFARRHPSCKHA